MSDHELLNALADALEVAAQRLREHSAFLLQARVDTSPGP